MTTAAHTYQSYAKINWFLHITARRADGYHTLETVFQRIDWHDEIRITPRDDGQIILNSSVGNIPNAQNLIIRAADALKQFAQQAGQNVSPLGANIHLQKNIPMGAGLGGGSSNAATTLLALNQLWHLNLNQLQLQTIGLGLGADVPFFVSPYNSALARGIGEELTPLALPECELLLVKPNVHADTRSVYQHPLLRRDHAPLNISIEALQTQLQNHADRNTLSNDMQAAAFAIAPEIAHSYSALKTAAPHAYVRMSGSGATVFACPHNEIEHQALKQWQAECPAQWTSRWCHTLA